MELFSFSVIQLKDTPKLCEFYLVQSIQEPGPMSPNLDHHSVCGCLYILNSKLCWYTLSTLSTDVDMLMDVASERRAKREVWKSISSSFTCVLHSSSFIYPGVKTNWSFLPKKRKNCSNLLRKLERSPKLYYLCLLKYVHGNITLLCQVNIFVLKRLPY